SKETVFKNKKLEMLENLRKKDRELEQQNENLLGLCRALRDNVDYEGMDEKSKNELISRILGDTTIFNQILVLNASNEILFSYDLKAKGAKDDKKSIWIRLLKSIVPFVQKGTGKGKQRLEELAIKGLADQLTMGLIGRNISDILQGTDELYSLQLGKKNVTLYIDVVQNKEKEVRFIFAIVFRGDTYIRQILGANASKEHMGGKKEGFYLYEPGISRLTPQNREFPPGEWKEEFEKICKEGKSGYLDNNFNDHYLISYFFNQHYRILLVSIASKKVVQGILAKQVRQLWVNLLAIWIALILVAVFFGSKILTPLGKLKEAMLAVETQKYDYKLEINTKDELEDLGNTLNTMLKGMAEREKLALSKAELKFAFSRFLSPEVVNEIENDPSKLELGGKTDFLTAFFTDIQGFSSFSEILSPQQLVELLNEYLTEMTDILLEANGTLDKYEGDAIIAFFGAPIENPNNPKEAMVVALTMQKRLGELRQKWKSEGDKWPDFVKEMKMRIGINSGMILTGNMGSQNRMNYTMMGDAVNLAARLEAAAKQYGIFTLVSEESLKKYRDDFVFREVDLIRVVGRKEPCRVYELLDFSENKEHWANFLALYNHGLSEFRKENFKKAMDYFKMSEQVESNTKMSPSKKFFHRCQNIINHAEKVPEGQVYNLTEK
ncbi:adenylate/guanylate cyclase domain-containing protein, partial [Candidatus Riflebacteria bacterium]